MCDGLVSSVARTQFVEHLFVPAIRQKISVGAGASMVTV
jgi:hypothetical protein